MSSFPKLYRSFLVRTWCENGATPTWRFLLQEIGIAPESARGFADFEQFVEFLRLSIVESTPPSQNETDFAPIVEEE
ncbi:MAG: hypothetical protein EYC68_00075 [Chloroflexota bacterium]|nr:MAG: hypothetical protein EYC68_00075 [Chloroflexota bacterium]